MFYLISFANSSSDGENPAKNPRSGKIRESESLLIQLNNATAGGTVNLKVLVTEGLFQIFNGKDMFTASALPS